MTGGYDTKQHRSRCMDQLSTGWVPLDVSFTDQIHSNNKCLLFNGFHLLSLKSASSTKCRNPNIQGSPLAPHKLNQQVSSLNVSFPRITPLNVTQVLPELASAPLFSLRYTPLDLYTVFCLFCCSPFHPSPCPG